ncbi:MAG: DUF3037 domain-containing protein [Pedobacter sp.]|nr:MAG: DUF3037 domain-containing protein [Pedobacter sp.]
MQERQLFEYAVVRWVPQVERDEFVNIGVIVYCAKQKFLKVLFHLDEFRLNAFNSTFDREEMLNHLNALHSICCAESRGGPIAKLDMASRFRWLTAMRSTIVQTSRVHPGYCDDPEETLNKIFKQLVLLP